MFGEIKEMKSKRLMQEKEIDSLVKEADVLFLEAERRGNYSILSEANALSSKGKEVKH